MKRLRIKPVKKVVRGKVKTGVRSGHHGGFLSDRRVKRNVRALVEALQ